MYNHQILLFIRGSMVAHGVSTPWISSVQLSPLPFVPLVGVNRGDLQHQSFHKYRRRRGRRARVQVELRKVWRQVFVGKSYTSVELWFGVSYCSLKWFPLINGWECQTRLSPTCLNPSLDSFGLDNMALLNARSIANKSFMVNDLVLSKKLEFLFLNKPWQRDMELDPLIKLCPKDCTFISLPRLSGNGGGLAAAFRSRFVCHLVSTGLVSSFELQTIKVGRTNPFYCTLIYRSPKQIIFNWIHCPVNFVLYS